MPETLTLRRPDDWHLHLRDGAALETTVPATGRVFRRAIVMPNLSPPVVDTAQALAYRERILAAIPEGVDFEPLMTLYLTDRTPPEEMRRAKDAGIAACKLYPAGATTNSAAGVRDLSALDPVLEAMQAADLPLLVHGETTAQDVDVFDREKVFLEETFAPATERFPELRMVFEHITCAEAARFVASAREGVAATITPQHLLLNRNDLFAGGLRPHHYCLPVLKRSVHQAALLEAATSGNPHFFLGTDSAPHERHAKECDHGCAGCYSAPAALPLYAAAFESVGALERLEGFASDFGPDFYGLPRNEERLTLRREAWKVPDVLPYTGTPDGTIVPFWADEELAWSVA